MPKRKPATRSSPSRGLLRANDAVLRHCLSFLPAPDLLRSVTRVSTAFARLLQHRQAWPTTFTFEFVRPGAILPGTGTRHSRRLRGSDTVTLPAILQRLARIGGFVDVDLSGNVVNQQVREHNRNRVTLRPQRVVLS